jgi:holin-like protein
MKAMRGLLVILVSLMLGNLITALTKLPIPGSIFGMLILLLLLQSKIVKLETVDPAAGGLISVMTMLLVPGAVNLMNIYEKLDGVIIQVLLITVVTTGLIMAVTGVVADRIIKVNNRKGEK